MSRSNRHIKQYEKELKSQGITVREIGEKFGFSYEQTHEFFKRYNNINEGKTIHKKGRPPQTDKYDIETNKINKLKYIIARKDSKIKTFEMENELIRDFLSLTERK